MNDFLFDDKEQREKYAEAVPLGRLGTPKDIEGLAVFLASDKSAYCTGGIYACDGELTGVLVVTAIHDSVLGYLRIMAILTGADDAIQI